MAAPIERLKQRSEFLHVAATRRKWVTPGLILQAANHPASDSATRGFRVGYTASRKVGGSVQRNRARRRLRAAVARVLPSHAEAGVDYVVIARRGTLDRPFADLTAYLEVACRHLAAGNPAGAAR